MLQSGRSFYEAEEILNAISDTVSVSRRALQSYYVAQHRKNRELCYLTEPGARRDVFRLREHYYARRAAEIGEDTFTRFYYGYMDAILREDWPEATALCDNLLISLRWVKEFALHNPIVMIIIVTAVLIGILYWFFGTELGCAIRATGSNPAMSRAQGINTNFNIVLGLAVSNGLVALSGALLSQYQGFADVGMGRGAIVIGLAAVIIGEALFSRIFHNFALKMAAVSLGAIIYYIVIQLVLTLGFDANLLKLLSASVVAIFLAVPYWKGKYFSKPVKKAKEDAKNA